MKEFLRSPDSGTEGGEVILAPSKPANAGNPNEVPTQFKEGKMPDSLKGQHISFDGSEPEITNEPKKEVVKSADESKPDGEQDTADGLEFNKPIVKTPEQLAKEAPKKPELSKLPEIKTETTPEPAIKTTVPAGQRDYSIFTEAEKPLAKALNNQQFALLSATRQNEVKVKTELAEAKTKLDAIAKDPNAIPQEWHNHPEAYTLHPQFQAGYQVYQQAQFEADFYRQQLIKIENNEEFQTIRGYDKRTGQPVLSELQKPTANDKVNMQSFMSEATNIANTYKGELGKFQNGFKARYETAYNDVQRIVDERWPWHKDEKDPRQAKVKEFLSVVPPEFVNHPATRVAALMWQTIFDVAKQNDDLRAKLATGKTVQQIQSEVEPTVSSVASPGGESRGKGNGKHPGKVATFDLVGMTD